MEFKAFLEDEQEINKKRKQIVDVICKAVKCKKKDRQETDDATLITFKCEGQQYVKDTQYEIVVAQDYFKKFARDMQRAIYITITKETNSHRNSDSITIETTRLSDPEFLKLLDSLKERFEKIAKK